MHSGQDLDDLSWIWPEASSPRTGFHDPRKCCKLPGKGNNQQVLLSCDKPVSYNGQQDIEKGVIAVYRQTHQPPDWTEGPKPGTRDLADYSGLGRLWILAENLPGAFLCPKSLSLHPQVRKALTSSMTLLFAADTDCYEKPQLFKTERIIDSGEPSPRRENSCS